MKKQFFGLKPRIVLHLKGKLDGNLTDVDKNTFKELVIGGGGRDVIFYNGVELSIHNFNYKEIKSRL